MHIDIGTSGVTITPIHGLCSDYGILQMYFVLQLPLTAQSDHNALCKCDNRLPQCERGEGGGEALRLVPKMEAEMTHPQ